MSDSQPAPTPATMQEATEPIPGTFTHRFSGGPLDGQGITFAGDVDAPAETTGPGGARYVRDGRVFRLQG